MYLPYLFPFINRIIFPNFTMDPKRKGIFWGSCMEESLLRDGVDIESAKAFESLSAKQQGRFQREPWRDKGFQEAKQKIV